MYNRFRFYDPADGVYGSQDPLGRGPNMGTPQGYVHNPLTWVDTLGLESYPKDDQALNYDAKNDQWVDSRTGKPTADRPYENPSSHNWGHDKPKTPGAKPNSVYTHVDKTMGKAKQNAIYNKDGDVVGHVDFKNHNPATSGHRHIFPQPGQPASGHGPNSPHIPNKSLPSGCDALPPGVKSQTPIEH